MRTFNGDGHYYCWYCPDLAVSREDRKNIFDWPRVAGLRYIYPREHLN